MKNFQKEFGVNFKRIRKFKNFTQDLVAERSGFSSSYISEVERGHANPTLSTAERLAKALDVEVFDLFMFLHSKATPEQIRERLIAILNSVDKKSLNGLYSAVLEAFKP